MVRFEKLTSETAREQWTLFCNVFSSAKTFEDWIKKHTGNPYTDEYYVYGALDENKLIGINGFILMHYRLGNNIYKVMQSCDSAIDPDYRHQGIFSKIIMTAMKDFAKEGMDFAIGFPNSNSYPGFMKLGWENMPQQQSFIILTKLTRALENKYDWKLPAIVDVFSYYWWRKILKASRQNQQILVASTTKISLTDIGPSNISYPPFFHLELHTDFLDWWLRGNSEGTFVQYVAEKDNKKICYLIIKKVQKKNDYHALIIDYGRFNDISNSIYFAGMARILHRMQGEYDIIIMSAQPGEKNNLFRKMGMVPFNKADRSGIFCLINENKSGEIKNLNHWHPQALEMDIILGV